MIIKDYNCHSFPTGSLANFIAELQEIQREHPDATVTWSVGGPRESDSIYVREPD